MGSDLESAAGYKNTIDRLEAVRKTNTSGIDYWRARDIHPILGYPAWDKFEPVIEKAAASLRENGIDPSHHVAETSVMMEVGKGAQRQGVDYFLRRRGTKCISLSNITTACIRFFYSHPTFPLD